MPSVTIMDVLAGERAAQHLIDVAATVPVRADAGLSDGEIHALEQRFGFEFAADHRAFLATVLPMGPGWPNWRRPQDPDLRRRLAWPVEGVLFDVEHNAVWLDAWGPRPASTAAAVAVARDRLAAVPQLVPVYAHRYLPSGRTSCGHPVLSVQQTDVVYYGRNLVDYLHREFPIDAGRDRTDPRRPPRATVTFWRDLVA